MTQLSPRQREIRARETLILGEARRILLDRGYFGLTMESVAKASDCPKGTMYQRFGCKEDLVLTLAAESLERRLVMLRRGAGYPGKSRERVAALGEAVALFARLNPDDARIVRVATGPIREKASPDRLSALIRAERAIVEILKGILEDGIRDGDLIATDPAHLNEMAFGIWALVDGSYTLIESGVTRNSLGLTNPFTGMYHVFNVLADGYGWRPLFHEHDWEETLATVRRTVFPVEAQALYGESNWYGDKA